MKHMHTNKPKQICKICSREFSRVQHLRDHVTRIHTKRERRHPCKFLGCGKLFLDEGDVRRHTKSSHSGGATRPRYSCTFPACGKPFLNKTTVLTHAKQEHGEISVRFRCTLFGKEFKEKQNRDNHIATHTGEKSYKCATCGMSFAHSSNFKRHEVGNYYWIEINCLPLEISYKKLY